MKAKFWLAIVALGVFMAFILFYTTPLPGSRLPAKSFRADNQMAAIQKFADYHRDDLLKVASLDNQTFVKTTGLAGSVFSFNDKGEVLDPWGKPYVITRDNDQITITSPGLDQYKKLSSFQKWWGNE